MPSWSSRFVRTALLNLLLGFLLGGIVLAGKGGLPGARTVLWLWPAHAELVMIGWTAQLVIGVAYWILPRYPVQPERGRVAPVAVAFVLLNAGVWSVVVAVFPGTPAWLAGIGRCAEALALGLFVIHAWPRVKAFGR
ncbi:MAG: hypothetical protein AB7I33_03415 [Gemmatimonadales bacterium]